MTTWDSANKAASVTLTNGDLTASVSAQSLQGAKSTTSKSTGVVTYEVTIGAGPPAFGICTAATPVTNVNSAGANYTVYLNAGTVRIWSSVANADQAVTSGTISVGDIWTLIIDITNSKMYTRRNGSNFVGDFVAGTGGVSIQAGNTWFAWFQGQNHSPDTVTAAFSSLANAPTGATAWDTTSAASPFIFPRSRHYVRR